MPNADLTLWPGQYVNVVLDAGMHAADDLGPDRCRAAQPEGAVRLVVKPDNTVEVRPVQVALTEGENSAISDGLKAGERVVVEGQTRLKDGAAVREGKRGRRRTRPRRKVAQADKAGGGSANDLRILHPQAGRDDPDVVRARARRAVRLQIPAGGGAAQRRISGRQRLGVAARRFARDDGDLGGDAADQAVRHHRRHRFDLDHQLARLDLDRHPVRARPRHRRGGRRRAGGDRAHAAHAAAGNDQPAELPEGQSGRRADPVDGADQRHRCR